MIVADTLRRNRKITRMTRTIVPIRVNCTSCTDSRIDWVRSKKTSSLIDCGICVRRPGRSSLNGVHDVDDVGARLSLNAENDGPFIFEPARDFIVLNAVDGSAEILNAHRRAVAIGHDHRLEGLRVGKLAV